MLVLYHILVLGGGVRTSNNTIILDESQQQWLAPCPEPGAVAKPFRTQLLKWVGNKQKQAGAIISHFPKTFGTYYEPFLWEDVLGWMCSLIFAQAFLAFPLAQAFLAFPLVEAIASWIEHPLTGMI